MNAEGKKILKKNVGKKKKSSRTVHKWSDIPMLSSNVEITLLNLCCYFIRRLPYRELSCAGGLKKQTITYKQNPQQVVS